MKDIFEKNKHGFDSESRTLTHFVAFKEHMTNKCLAKPSRRLLLTALYTAYDSRRLHEEDQLQFSNSKHIPFLLNKQKFHFRMIVH